MTQTRTSVTLSTELCEWLDREAKAEKRSRANYISLLLDRAMKNHARQLAGLNTPDPLNSVSAGIVDDATLAQ